MINFLNKKLRISARSSKSSYLHYFALIHEDVSDMRQAMSQQHQQQMDTGDEYKHAPNGAAPNLAPRRDSMPASPTDTPMFYISTVESTKHKFTVTTQFNYPNQQQGAPNGAIMASCTNGGSNGSQNQPEFTHGHMSAPQVRFSKMNNSQDNYRFKCLDQLTF